MTAYLATINVPGYLPMDDDPPVFETPREAWAYLADERRRGEDDEETESYSGTVDALDALAQPGRELCPFTVYGPTPGGRIHDLGLAYTVTALECECAYQPGDSGHELHCPLHIYGDGS
jgi:hypothetical protein